MEARIITSVQKWKRWENKVSKNMGNDLFRLLHIDSDTLLGNHVERAQKLVDTAQRVHTEMDALISSILENPSEAPSRYTLSILWDRVWFYSLVYIRDEVIRQIRLDCIRIFMMATPQELAAYAQHAVTAWRQHERAGQIFQDIKKSISRLDHLQ